MRSLAAAVLALLLTLAVAEVVVRVWNPDPRTQIVRDLDGSLTLSTLHGEPIWRPTHPDMRGLAERPCGELVGEEGRVVLLVGDSILFMTERFEADKNVASVLERRLGGPQAGWCVINAAVAGYNAQQKYVVAKDILAREPVDLVLWEVWGEGPSYRRIGDAIYAVGQHHLDPAGTPTVPGVPLPPAVNRWLFTNSRLWAYAALALGVRDEPEELLSWHDKAIDAAQEAGAALHFAFFPDLGGPFDGPPRIFHPVHEPLRALADKRGVPTTDMRRQMIGQDVEAIRLNTCCHYNNAGHAVLAEVLEPIVREALAPPTPGEGP